MDRRLFVSSRPSRCSGVKTSKRVQVRAPDSTTSEEAHPIEHFLFKSRAGNCEYFAGALCFMLRSIGIPARVVEGFLGVERTEQPNEFIVRFSRAHAWVEADLGDGNWTTLDATPPGSETSESYLWRLAADLYDSLDYKWTKNVIYFDRSDQAMIFAAFTKLVSGQVSLPFAIPPTLKAYALPIITGALRACQSRL